MKKLVIISFVTLVLSLVGNPSFAVHTCGDVYPPPSSPGEMDCGDGLVDIFDIMQATDITLGEIDPTNCEISHGDIPIGTPPYCGRNVVQGEECLADGEIDVFDILVIIDKALGKANCCDYCFDECMLDEDCDDGNECTDDTCVDSLCTNVCNATSSADPCCADPACYNDDICGVSASCTITPEDVLVTDGNVSFEVDLCLANQNDNVRSVQLDICEEIDGSPFDCLECVGCQITGRTPGFTCVSNELPDGCCRIVLYTMSTGSINQGICSVAKVDYNFDRTRCPFTECITLRPTNTTVSDPNIHEITSAGLLGEVCFTDFDSDSLLNDADNCPAIPNGPDLGTCVIGDVGQSCMDDGECGGVPGSCSMNQEDADGDGIGDTCDLCTDLDGDDYGREGLDNSECTYPEYDCDDSEYTINPGVVEACNGKDDDCDTFIDEDLIQSCGVGVCQGIQTCAGGSWSECSTYNNECDDCALCSAEGECNVLKTASDVCRASVGVCDITEYCTGTSPACPPDVYQPDDTACDDDDVCNGHEICQSSVCTAGVSLNCDDDNVCTDDSCDPLAGCVYANNANPCNDGIVCTENDSCFDGECYGTPNSTLCDDSNVCTDDICDIALGCIYTNNDDSCNDDIFCNGTDTCSNGTCSIHSGDPCPPLFCSEELGMCIDLSDDDDDGIRDDGDNSGTYGDYPCTGGEAENCDDNCPHTPNGPDSGTCAWGTGSIFVTTGVTCTDDGDCTGKEICQKNQEDCNGNGIGDVCECYADVDGDGNVYPADLSVILDEYGRTDCIVDPLCEADLNGDGNVYPGDLSIFLEEYGREDCPVVP